MHISNDITKSIYGQLVEPNSHYMYAKCLDVLKVFIQGIIFTRR